VRLVDLLRGSSPVIFVLLAPILMTRRRLIRKFERAAATSPESAITPSLGGPIRRWWLKRLARDGVLRSTPDGAHWLDLGTWSAYRSVRRRRAMTVLIVILLSMALMVVLNRDP
jgi:hypothetical protein